MQVAVGAIRGHSLGVELVSRPAEIAELSFGGWSHLLQTE